MRRSVFSIVCLHHDAMAAVPLTTAVCAVLQSKRVKPKVSKSGYESEEDAPLSARKPAKVKRKAADSEDEYDAKPVSPQPAS